MTQHITTAVLILTMMLNTAATAGQSHAGSETDGVVLLGQCYAFILKAPAGWVLDTTVAKSSGLAATLYPEGSSWKGGISVMYVRVIYKDKHKRTLGDVVQSDIKEFKSRNRTTTVSSMPAVTTRDRKRALMRHFYDAQNKNEEAVAYIDELRLCSSGSNRVGRYGERGVVVLVVLSSRTRKDYDRSLEAFRQLAGSYFFVHELAGL